MINSTGHTSARARGTQPQHRSPDLTAKHLHWADSDRTKPVRRSVDLSPMYHRKLTQWCAETADVIGTARVTGQDVIRALVARLLMDESLARRIRDDLSMDL
ncbi:MAG: hypothetical protein JO281_09615 [Pseudonocardiales bacterium]|nr:hypothetical protein [Pseudonocardiales bacterium]MBV9161789.1 hypothetical protein [Pseudonocardiales bacterium]